MRQFTPGFKLDQIDRILFVTDVSTIDFIYLECYSAKLMTSNPNLKIDLFINTKNKFFYVKDFIQVKYLQDLCCEKKYINSVYFDFMLKSQDLKKIQELNYSLIVLLDKSGCGRQIKIAKKLSPHCIVIGAACKPRWYNFFKKRRLKHLDFKIDFDGYDANISKFYSDIFSQISGIEIGEPVVKPMLNIPKKWIIYAKLRFLKWEIDKRGHRFGRVFFINSFDDDGSHALPIKMLYKFILDIKRNDEQGDINFVLFSPMNKFNEIKKFFEKNSINNLFLFSADYDFFQIPSMLSISDTVYSVNGFCADLAAAFNVPLVKIDKGLCQKL